MLHFGKSIWMHGSFIWIYLKGIKTVFLLVDIVARNTQETMQVKHKTSFAWNKPATQVFETFQQTIFPTWFFLSCPSKQMYVTYMQLVRGLFPQFLIWEQEHNEPHFAALFPKGFLIVT